MTRIVLGRVTGPFGIRGWLKVTSFTDPPGQIFDFPLWRADAPGQPAREFRRAESRAHGRGFVVRLEGVENRDAAIALGKPELWVEREELPALPAGEHYRADLLGFEVVNLAGKEFGRVDRFVDLPASVVMVVIGERERWLPVGPGRLLRVDRQQRRITVDWDAEF